VEVVRRGESGWLAEAGSAEGLATTLGELLAERDTLMRMIADKLPRAAFERDAPEERTLRGYEELLERRGHPAAPRDGLPAAPRVTALVACEAGGGDALPTLESLEAQDGVLLRSVLVGPSGTLAGTGRVLPHVDAVAAGWAAGLAQASDELVLLVPAGAVLERDFLPRAAAVLAREPAVAWVTAFGRMGDTPAHAPLGSYLLPLAELDASPSVALVRRGALESAVKGGVPNGATDLFVRLGEEDAHGVVLQEPLFANLPRRATRRSGVVRAPADQTASQTEQSG
jgi:hypothetical protein